jgi:hypothetical protein
MTQPAEKKLKQTFDDKILKKMGNPVDMDEITHLDPEATTPEYEPYNDEVHKPIPDIDEVTPEEFDNYIGAEVKLPLGGIIQSGRVRKHARNEDDELYGTKNTNPILDTRQYEVEFPSGEVAEYTANIVAESMFAQCDAEGNHYLLLDLIVDHKSSEQAVKYADRYQVIKGKRQPRKTTDGWKLCVEWKDGSTSRERLADMKRVISFGSC